MIRIATDSAVDFEPAEFEKYRIDCIPLSVNFGEREYKENIDLSKEKFYELLGKTDELPRTAQPSPQGFIELIEEAKEAGDDIIIILLSSGISGTYQSALAIKEMVGYERCFIVDSKSATGGQRMVVDMPQNSGTKENPQRRLQKKFPHSTKKSCSMPAWIPLIICIRAEGSPIRSIKSEVLPT